MFILDAHEDIAYNALYFGRDYRQSASETRAREVSSERLNGSATLGLPDALLGRVGITFATLFTQPATSPQFNAVTPRYQTPREAYQQALRQWDYYNRLVDETDQIALIRNQKELGAVIETWQSGKKKRRQGFVFLMENGDPILEPKQFEEWYERGVRIVGPAWAASRYCGGTGQPGGLTSDGRLLLDVMAGFNAILDLSHMAEQAFLESLEQYQGPIIASHSNPRHFRNSDRHLSDDMIHLLAQRDGVMGIVLLNSFLSNSWTKGSPKAEMPFSIVLDAIDYVCQLTGSAAHVGIGTDLDGGFGVESIPVGFDTVTDLWKISDALAKRGYSEADVEKILSGNFLRKLREALPA